MSDQLSKVFAALADPTRRDLVARLTLDDATVGELAEPYDVSLQAEERYQRLDAVLAEIAGLAMISARLMTVDTGCSSRSRAHVMTR